MKLIPIIALIAASAAHAYANDLFSHYIIADRTIGPTSTTSPGVSPSLEIASFTNVTGKVMVVVRSQLSIYRGDDINNHYIWVQLMAMRPGRPTPDGQNVWLNQIMRTPNDFVCCQPELIMNTESMEPDGVELQPGEELCVKAGSPDGKTRIGALIWYYLK